MLKRLFATALFGLFAGRIFVVIHLDGDDFGIGAHFGSSQKRQQHQPQCDHDQQDAFHW
ncbi:hypothetical protein SDC9_208340 [bioreactor metagenome]|uniref:Uncharacterized protein n=1 Tax=bioreactor metagenome TaxID=1076179 RepID=A0A645JAH1_9ZZZZ